MLDHILIHVDQHITSSGSMVFESEISQTSQVDEAEQFSCRATKVG